jgi:hypothetical protein
VNRDDDRESHVQCVLVVRFIRLLRRRLSISP